MNERENIEKEEKVIVQPIMTKDRHHICYPKRKWDTGYARLICMAFVRHVPVEYHREMHAQLKGVPVPPADLLHKAWDEYQADKYAINAYDVTRAAAWLYVHIPDVEFRKAMQFQIDFFVTRPYMGKA